MEEHFTQQAVDTVSHGVLRARLVRQALGKQATFLFRKWKGREHAPFKRMGTS